MKLLIPGLAVALCCVPVFAQDTSVQGEALSKIHEQASLHFHNKATESRALVNQSTAVGAISKQDVYGTSEPYGNTTVIVTPNYGYPAYPAYGYPAPYPAPYPYGYPAPYPYPYPYPANTIVGAPIAPPTYSWERPAYATSIPLGTTYYNNGPNCYPNYPGYYNSYPSYGYGYGSRQTSRASVSIGSGSVRVKIGGSKTTVR